jgi:phage I-like protein
MSTKHTAAPTALAADKLPTEFRLFKMGDNTSTKGTFRLTAASMARCLATRRHADGRSPIDFDHQITHGFFGETPAAGWFKLQGRADGLYAVEVEWTPKGAQALRDRTWRYTSPTFLLSSGATENDPPEVVEIVACALTNVPALDNIEPIAASETMHRPIPNYSASRTIDARTYALAKHLNVDPHALARHQAKLASTPPRPAPALEGELTAQELEVCRLSNVRPADFIASKLRQKRGY